MAAEALAVVAPPEISFEEFLTAYDGIHAEWVDGTVHVMSPGNERQSVLTRFLASTLQYWADVHDLGEVYVPPFSLKVSDTRAREPDVFFVRREALGQVHGSYVDGPVDLGIDR